MKKSLLALVSVFLILILLSIGLVELIGTKKSPTTSNDNNTVVTSFYPEYIIVKNIIASCDDINLVNMTSETTGCLHDYQITSKDMKTLSTADLLIINGAGMEPFVDDIHNSLPSLTIVDSSEDTDLLECSHTHSHEHTDSCDSDCNIETEIDEDDKHNHDECDSTYNSHIWLDLDNYIFQIKTITTTLCDTYPEHKNIFKDNSKSYINKVKDLKSDIADITSSLDNDSKDKSSKKDAKNNKPNNKLNKTHENHKHFETIIFHDSFAYLADSFHFDIADTVNIDSDTSLSAGTVAEVISTIKDHKIKILLSEKQFKDSIAKSISKETDAKVYVLDSLVTGEDDKNAYINGMKANINTFKKIYKNNN
ncbi:MAG: zinc ABC transporter substrate-binding protein [Lachnospiraceae bacterium]|nr:zinc ABC transporter substrate-binding protein [Lachnospiraceae bacterium]